MSNLDHIILYTFLFIYFYLWGRYNSNVKNSKRFWISALVPILLYSVIVGSRYGWGPDYLWYKFRLENAFSFKEDQVGFKLLNQAITGLGFNFVGGYIIYSLIFVICAFVLIRSYGSESKYMYAFLIPATLFVVNYAIRQGVALSFVLLAIYFFYRKRWISLVICLFIGATIHTAIIVTAAGLGACFFLFKKPISWKITIPLYLFFTFLFDSRTLGFLAPLLQKYITLDNKFQSYIDNADMWFGVEGADKRYEQGNFALIMSSLFYLSVFFIGFKALKIKPSSRILFLYNSFVLGVIFYRAVFLFEILRRFAEPLVMLYFVVLGYGVYVFSAIVIDNQALTAESNHKLNLLRQNLPIFRVGLVFILVYLFMYWGRFVFMNPTGIFYWNK